MRKHKVRITIILIAIFAVMAFGAGVAQAQQSPPPISSMTLFRSYEINTPVMVYSAKSKKHKKHRKLIVKIYGARRHVKVLKKKGVRLDSKNKGSSHLVAYEYFCTLYYKFLGTKPWVMWYTNALYTECNTKTHEITLVAMKGHWGKVNKVFQLFGWEYTGDSRNAWTYELYKGHTHGEFYSHYIGSFKEIPLRLGVVIGTRSPAACISARYDGTYTLAGSKG